MKALRKRLERLQRKIGPIERQFVAWPHNPWTPEQKAEAIRRDPDQLVFWKRLREGLPRPKPETDETANP